MAEDGDWTRWALDATTLNSDPVVWISTMTDSLNRTHERYKSVQRSELTHTQHAEMLRLVSFYRSLGNDQATLEVSQGNDSCKNCASRRLENDAWGGRIGESKSRLVRPNRWTFFSLGGQILPSFSYPNTYYEIPDPDHPSNVAKPGQHGTTAQMHTVSAAPPCVPRQQDAKASRQNMAEPGQREKATHTNETINKVYGAATQHQNPGSSSHEERSQHYRTSQPPILEPAIPPHIPVAYCDQSGYDLAASYNESLKREGYGDYSEIHPQQRKNFFIEGRVFVAPWIQPWNMLPDTDTRWTNNVLQGVGDASHAQFRRFILVKHRSLGATSSVCVPIFTHDGRRMLASNQVAANNAQAYSGAIVPPLQPGEALTKDAIQIVVSDPVESIDFLSRIDFGQLHEIQHSIIVRDVGRVKGVHWEMVQQYVLEVSGLLPSSAGMQKETEFCRPSDTMDTE